MKKRWLPGAIVFFIVFGLISYYYFQGKKVKAFRAEKKDYVEKLLVTGTVQGKEFSTLTSGVDGVVQEIRIREGEPMKKGDVIAKLDTQQIEAQISQAEALYKKAVFDLETLEKQETEKAKAALKNAEVNYGTSKDEFDKYSQLFNKSYISELDYNLKKNAHSSAEAQVKMAREQLNSLKESGSQNKSAVENVKAAENSLETLKKNLLKYYVFAPYDGDVTVRNVEVGQSVAPHTSMFEVSSSGEKIISIDLDEKYINRVEIGTPLKIYPYSDNGRYSLGKLYYKGIDIDSSKGTLEIRSTIEDVLPEFLYNSTVNIVIEGKKVKDGILLQGIYVEPKRDKKYAYIEKAGKAELVEIEGEQVIDGIVVTKGLNDGDIILSVKDSSPGIRVNPQTDSN